MDGLCRWGSSQDALASDAKGRHPSRLKGLHSEQRRMGHMQADPFEGRLLPQSSAGGSRGTRAKIARASNSGNCRDC